MSKLTYKEFPKEYIEMIGKIHEMSGSIFNSKEIPPTEFVVLGLRWGRGYIVNIEDKTRKKHSVIELLVKNNEIKERWTKGFKGPVIIES